MDSFTLTHYQKLFPANEFKVQEVISQEYLEYGARVENSSLASCLKNLRFSEESELYEYAEFYMLGKYNKVIQLLLRNHTIPIRSTSPQKVSFQFSDGNKSHTDDMQSVKDLRANRKQPPPPPPPPPKKKKKTQAPSL